MYSLGSQFGFEGYVVDASRWQVQWQDQPVALNQKTFFLLLYLIEHRDRVVGKDELMHKLWPNLIVEEGNVTQQIFLLRSALSKHASKAKIIETVARRGYRFAATLESPTPAPDASQLLTIEARHSVTTLDLCEEIAEEAVTPCREPSIPASARPMPARRWAAVAALICLLSGVAGYQLRGVQDHDAGSASVVRLGELHDDALESR